MRRQAEALRSHPDTCLPTGFALTKRWSDPSLSEPTLPHPSLLPENESVADQETRVPVTPLRTLVAPDFPHSVFAFWTSYPPFR